MEPLRGSSHRQALALPTNIRLCWKGLPRTNALAYCEKPSHTAIKSFITLATDSRFSKQNYHFIDSSKGDLNLLIL